MPLPLTIVERRGFLFLTMICVATSATLGDDPWSGTWSNVGKPGEESNEWQ